MTPGTYSTMNREYKSPYASSFPFSQDHPTHQRHDQLWFFLGSYGSLLEMFSLSITIGEACYYGYWCNYTFPCMIIIIYSMDSLTYTRVLPGNLGSSHCPIYYHLSYSKIQLVANNLDSNKVNLLKGIISEKIKDWLDPSAMCFKIRGHHAS